MSQVSKSPPEGNPAAYEVPALGLAFDNAFDLREAAEAIGFTVVREKDWLADLFKPDLRAAATAIAAIGKLEEAVLPIALPAATRQPEKRDPRASVGPGDAGLLTPSEAARRLRCSPKTLLAHVRNGDLRYVQIGGGKSKPRRMITPADLNDFIETQVRRAACPSIGTKTRHITTSTSKSEVVAFSALQASRPGAKRKL